VAEEFRAHISGVYALFLWTDEFYQSIGIFIYLYIWTEYPKNGAKE
jgi:hypothetical protein